MTKDRTTVAGAGHESTGGWTGPARAQVDRVARRFERAAVVAGPTTMVEMSAVEIWAQDPTWPYTTGMLWPDEPFDPQEVADCDVAACHCGWYALARIEERQRTEGTAGGAPKIVWEWQPNGCGWAEEEGWILCAAGEWPERRRRITCGVGREWLAEDLGLEGRLVEFAGDHPDWWGNPHGDRMCHRDIALRPDTADDHAGPLTLEDLAAWWQGIARRTPQGETTS